MKVKITYKEVQYFEYDEEVEMTKKEYKEYLKTGKVDIKRTQDGYPMGGDECWIGTDFNGVYVEELTK